VATRIHEVLSVDPAALQQRGVFNGFVDIDSQLYVDPHLLTTASTPELQGSYDEYCRYLAEVLRILRAAQVRGDRMFREGARRLLFREVPYVALGYSKDDTQGSGIGIKLATHLADTAVQIIKAGIEDPTIFDLVGLIEENIGADRISDMTSRVIMPRLLEFSARIAGELQVKTVPIRLGGKVNSVPMNPQSGRPLIVVPSEILRTLPVARDWSDRDVIVAENQALRQRVNSIIGDTWKRATRHTRKQDLRDILIGNPELIRDLLAQYKKKPSRPYDFDADPEGLFLWNEAAVQFVQQFPLALIPVALESILATVQKICEHFGSLVENNGLSKLLYDKDKKRRPELFPQLLFFGIADAYCSANNLDLSREPNAGRGPVDFKMSKGAAAKVSVELKYSSNKKLVHGLETQLPIYDKAEKAHHSIYLILRTTEREDGIDRVLDLRNRATSEGRRAPIVLVFDARLQPSASKAEGTESDEEPDEDEGAG
jgi:hypothetical protein